MYCIKVNPGSERIKVRQVASGFNPKYREAEGNGKIADKRLAVPGYVFTMQYTPGAKKVPDEEWKIIEAISDPHLSTVDQRRRKVVEGPLKDIEEYISVIQASRVKVSAMILGEQRTYWLAVDNADGEAPSEEEENDNSADEDAETVEDEPSVSPSDGIEEKKNRKAAQIPRSKYDFTDEQKAAMMARADEIGIREAAKEFSVPWQAIAQLKRREREKNGEPPVRKAQKPGTRKRRKAVAAGTPELSAVPEDVESLRAQNTMLRERLSKLEAQAEKLKNAIIELI